MVGTPTTTATAEESADPSGHRNRFAYQPALDGLRAIAVSVVVLYHLGYGWMQGGFMGVDAFFVLSGFLITSLLLTESAAEGAIRLGAFWSRRVRRLLPALLVMVVVVVVYATWFRPAIELGRLRGDAVASLFYVANWRLISQLYSPFQHLWSLAVEEQFYLIWPPVVVLVTKLAHRPWRALLLIASIGVVASQLFTIIVYDPQHIAPAYFSTPARMNTIFVGCALGTALLLYPKLVRDRSARTMTVVSVVALATCTLAWVRAAPSREFFHGGDTVFALAFAALLFSLQRPGGIVGRALAVRPLVWLGGISYAVYLWQWPVILYVDESRTGMSGVPLDLLRIVLTLVIALVSTRLVELPVRRSRVNVLLWAIPATIGALVVVLVATTDVALSARERFPIAYDTRCFRPSTADRGATRVALRRAGVGRDPALTGSPVTVVGDSAVCNLRAGLDAAGPLTRIRTVDAARPACGVVAGDTLVPDGTPGPAGCLDASRSAYRRDGARTGLLVWWSTLEGRDLVVGGRTVRAGTAAHTRVLRDRMEHWLRDMPADVRLAVVTVPLPTTGDPKVRRQVEHLRTASRAFAAAHPGRVTLVDLAGLQCHGQAACVATVDQLRNSPGAPLPPDGTARLTAWMLSRLAAPPR
jgi:peptidoglycan/LPS O-acetylase OafA/YrhL